MKYCLYYQYEYAACIGLFPLCQCNKKHGEVNVSPTDSLWLLSGDPSPLLFLRVALPSALRGSLSPFSLCICNRWSPRSLLSYHVPCLLLLVSPQPLQSLPIKNEELQPISGLNLEKLSVLSRDFKAPPEDRLCCPENSLGTVAAFIHSSVVLGFVLVHLRHLITKALSAGWNSTKAHMFTWEKERRLMQT